jgi:hypothetical protein
VQGDTDTINGKMAHRGRSQYSDFAFAFGHSGRGWTCCWFDPVENDPFRTYQHLNVQPASAR